MIRGVWRDWGIFMGSSMALPGLLLLGGCASTSQHAPVVERAVTASPVPTAAATPRKPGQRTVRAPDSRPASHTVQKGDTLYGISFEYGFDYKEVAEWNGIEPPYIIRPGQQIRLVAPSQTTSVGGSAQVVVTPLKAPSDSVPVVNGDALVKSEPKALKLPYTEAAMQGDKGATKVATPVPAAPAATVAVVAEKAVPKVAEEKKEAKKLVEEKKLADDKKPAEEKKPADDKAALDDDEKIDWGWPAQGKTIGEFSESGSTKGIDIAGKTGQAVLAAASGKVVYSGSGLRGYGKLIIIKHNKTYLSAYAHNSQIMVKEGQNVTKGQKIAEMGDSDADRVKLHFEIRRYGKPVDPSKYLSGDGAA